MKSNDALARHLALCGLMMLAVCSGRLRADETASYQVGVAKLKMTPQRAGWLLAYDRHQRAEGVENDLWLRALALRDTAGRQAVLVSADVLGFPPGMSQTIRTLAQQRYSLPEGHLLLAASHTHNGPVLPERLSLTIYHDFNDDEAREVHDDARLLEAQVIQVIGLALAQLQPATLHYGVGRAEFGRNRRLERNPEGPVDPDVPVLAVRAATGELIAVVFGYACHGTTVMADTFFKYFGDYPGVAADELEQRLPGTVALFVAGCGGDINPDPRGTVELARLHGRELARQVRTVFDRSDLRILDGPLRCQWRRIDLPLSDPPSRELLTKMLSHERGVTRRYAREMLRQMDEGQLPVSVPYPLLVWQLGTDLTLVALSGEVCVDYSMRLKQQLGPDRTWVAGYATEVPCYIPSERVLAEGGYEAGWREEFGRAAASPAMATYGWPAPFAPGLEQRIVHTVLEMAP